LREEPRWLAKWIAPALPDDQTNVYFRARQVFVLDNIRGTCLLHIAAESRYLLYVNGEEIGIGPVRGTQAVNYFDSFDIAPRLRIGENWIAVVVHCPGIPTFKAAPHKAGVLLQADDGTLLASNETWQVAQARDWRSDVGLYTFQIGYMEWRNLQAEPVGWQTGEDKSDLWQTPIVLSPAEGFGGKRLRPRDIPSLLTHFHLPVDVIKSFALKHPSQLDDVAVAHLMNEEPYLQIVDAPNLASLLEPQGEPATLLPQSNKDGISFIVDFGREVNGGLQIDIDAAAGTVVDIAYDEALRGERLPVLVNEYAFADRYILRDGRQEVASDLLERGFKVVQLAIRNFDRPVRIFSILGIDRIYPFNERASFVCSDPLLNQIWSACCKTLSACATDTFVDCPWRENAFYFNDMAVEGVTSLQAFGDGRINARCMRLAVSSPRSDGLIQAAVPTGIVPGLSIEASADRMVLLSGNLLFPRMLEDHLLYTGDEALAREMMPAVTKMLEAFASWEDADGLITPPEKHWNIVDWSYEVQRYFLTGRNTAVLNWLYVLSLDTAVRLSRYLSDESISSTWKSRAARTAAGIEKRFWRENHNGYIEWTETTEPPSIFSQLAHAAACLSNRVLPDRIMQVEVAIGKSGFLAPELYSQHLVLQALVKAGKAIDAIEVVRKYWGPIVLSGSTTIWENGVQGLPGKKAFNGAGSLCHGFSTTPIDFLQGTVLGIRPTAPGFKRCSCNPHSVGLEHAAGRVPTPLGNISISWRRSGESINIEITIPNGVTADLPNGTQLTSGFHRVTLDACNPSVAGHYAS
jgi:hypothetical protein